TISRGHGGEAKADRATHMQPDPQSGDGQAGPVRTPRTPGAVLAPPGTATGGRAALWRVFQRVARGRSALAEQDGVDASARGTRLGGPAPIGPSPGSPLDELAAGGVREPLPRRARARVPVARPPHRGAPDRDRAADPTLARPAGPGAAAAPAPLRRQQRVRRPPPPTLRRFLPRRGPAEAGPGTRAGRVRRPARPRRAAGSRALQRRA